MQAILHAKPFQCIISIYYTIDLYGDMSKCLATYMRTGFGLGLQRESAVTTVVFLARQQSSSSFGTRPVPGNNERLATNIPKTKVEPPTGLARLPTANILRNIFLGAFFTTPMLSKPGFAILNVIANSRSRILNPDVNLLLRFFLKPLLYSQFCAGTGPAEIARTRENIKRVGYSGIILCYGKDILIDDKSNELRSANDLAVQQSAEIAHWRDGNLSTLDMIGAGDWLGMKFTGAGSMVTTALLNGEDPPNELVEAMDAICHKAASQQCRIWVDAEQQVLQHTIDRWAMFFMSKHNLNGKALVHNTIQAYLKDSRDNVKKHLAKAQAEGWALGIKLVRGAYINSEPRHLIHDTKANTDANYDSIVHDLLSGSNLGFAEDKHPRDVHLFVAGHNPDSVAKAMDLIQVLYAEGKLKTMPDFGQLQGMGDVLGCKVLQQCEDLDKERELHGTKTVTPRIYKCLTWGSVQECLGYLFRRAVENSGGTDRMRDGLSANVRELRRRMVRPLTGR